MVQNYSMRLDHVSYVTTHDQLADTVQRLGARLESTFVDGGIHPRFGTRNFTCALKDGLYLEVVCPLEHPSTELTPWGRAVTNKAREGGGWLTWVFSTQDLTPIEKKFGRDAVEGHRTRPDGTDLRWRQIGVKEISDSREFPFFIEWLTSEHPSQHGLPQATIQKIVISDSNQLADSWFKEEILSALDSVVIEWVNPADYENESGIVAVYLATPSGVVVLD